jgi:hypothetical protein
MKAIWLVGEMGQTQQTRRSLPFLTLLADFFSTWDGDRIRRGWVTAQSVTPYWQPDLSLTSLGESSLGGVLVLIFATL